MEERNLEIMEAIINEKEKEIDRQELQPLDPEGEAMAGHKRYTIDMVDTPTDPLR